MCKDACTIVHEKKHGLLSNTNQCKCIYTNIYIIYTYICIYIYIYKCICMQSIVIISNMYGVVENILENVSELHPFEALSKHIYMLVAIDKTWQSDYTIL